MKVLEVVNLNPNKFGSFEKYCLGYGVYLRESGHQHRAFFNGEPCHVLADELEKVEGQFENQYFNNLGVFDSFRLLKYIRDNDIDVVHLHFYPMFSFFTFAARFIRCKLFLSYRISGDFSANTFPLNLLKRIRNRILGIGVDGVFCVSGFARKKFVHNFEAKSETAHVVHNGLNWNYFPVAQNTHSDKAVTDGFQVICVAALIPDKGVIDVIDAASMTIEKIPDLKLLIVGDGADRHSLDARVDELGLKNNVSFLGSRDDVPALLNSSQIAVVPSRWGEAFGFTVIEAMAAGIPVVASSVGGIPEIIDQKETGMLVESANPQQVADAILYLYNHTEERSRLGEGARQRVKDYFTVKRVYQQQFEHYQRSIR